MMHTTQSAEVDQLAAALCKAQAAMPAAEKNSENAGFKRNGKPSRYADLGAVHDALRVVLSENGLCVAQTGAALSDGRMAVETTLMHSSGQWIRGCLPMTPIKDATPHAIGGAVTYGRRYGLCAMVGLVADDDDDGNTASGKTHAKPQAAKPKPKAEGLGAERRKNAEAYVDEFFADNIPEMATMYAKLGIVHDVAIPDLTDAEISSLGKLIAERKKANG